MAKQPVWLPHPNGIRRRGLDIQNGVLTWAACNQGDTRRESIYLNDYGLTLASSDPAVVTAAYGPKSGHRPYPVHVVARAPGKATLTATGKDGKSADLEIAVYGQTNLSISFKAVRTENWSSNLSAAKAVRLVKNLNYIYSYQGNFYFTMKGAPAHVDIPGLPDVVDNDDIDQWGWYRDCGADITVFFVKENDVLGTSWRDLIMMEDVQAPPHDEMTLAHEVGHRLGLRHPDPPLPSNLMNQTKVGDRHRMRIYLTRQQIERITNRANWKQMKSLEKTVCAIKSLF
jgi:hypothetical protein